MTTDYNDKEQELDLAPIKARWEASKPAWVLPGNRQKYWVLPDYPPDHEFYEVGGCFGCDAGLELLETLDIQEGDAIAQHIHYDPSLNQDVPALIAEVERLRAKVAKFESLFEQDSEGYFNPRMST